jgi:hypothetical protein
MDFFCKKNLTKKKKRLGSVSLFKFFRKNENEKQDRKFEGNFFE